MTAGEKKKRFDELVKIEEILKSKRDFSGLINVFDEYMNLFDSIRFNASQNSKKVYCLVRLGRIKEAEETIKKLISNSFLLDQDEIKKAVEVVCLFLETGKAYPNFFQINTVKTWLKDRFISKQVVEIVFDYADFADDIKPFDIDRLFIIQNYFSEEIIEWVFLGMKRKDNINIYYHKQLKIVQQDVEGYLSSYMTEDQSTENRKIINKIQNSEIKDEIIQNIHFLIPQLALIKYKCCFLENAKSFELTDLEEFINDFDEYIFEIYQELDISIDDLKFDEIVSKEFFMFLDQWKKDNFYDVDIIKTKKLNQIILHTKQDIVIEYLKEVYSPTTPGLLITINGEPSYSILHIDNYLAGRTPFRVKLDFGFHTLRLQRWNEITEKIIELKPGGPTAFYLNLTDNFIESNFGLNLEFVKIQGGCFQKGRRNEGVKIIQGLSVTLYPSDQLQGMIARKIRA